MPTRLAMKSIIAAFLTVTGIASESKPWREVPQVTTRETLPGGGHRYSVTINCSDAFRLDLGGGITMLFFSKSGLLWDPLASRIYWIGLESYVALPSPARERFLAWFREP